MSLSLTLIFPLAGNNGKPQEVLNRPVEQGVFPGNYISSSDTLYLRSGLGQSDWEKDNEYYAHPYDINIFIDGVEIHLLRFAFNDKDGFLVGEPVKWLFFYHIFEPGYFTTGWHYIYYVFTWYDGYGFFTYDGEHVEFRTEVEWTPDGWFYVY